MKFKFESHNQPSRPLSNFYQGKNKGFYNNIFLITYLILLLSLRTNSGPKTAVRQNNPH